MQKVLLIERKVVVDLTADLRDCLTLIESFINRSYRVEDLFEDGFTQEWLYVSKVDLINAQELLKETER